MKITMITGATSGIGLAAMKGLAGESHILIGTARSEDKADAAKAAILSTVPDAQVSYLLADFSSQQEIRSLAKQAEETLRSYGRDSLDVLVNNAGTVTSWYTLTEDGYELQFAVNHLAPFLLTHLLLPYLQKAPTGRILTVSSGSHRHTRMHWRDLMFSRHYGTLKAYKQSKLANVLFSFEFNRRSEPDSSVKAYAIDPGLVNTHIGEKGTNGFVNWFWNRRSSRGTTPEIAAETIVYLACRREIPYKNEWYWKECHPIPASRYARKNEPTTRLWELSLDLCRLRED
ncbi:SDR family NAD(P)-dependent oxidoreductase [bacterium]|nr:SDR family NAD(P)-dependent oxidoreductase [bacterium]